DAPASASAAPVKGVLELVTKLRKRKKHALCRFFFGFVFSMKTAFWRNNRSRSIHPAQFVKARNQI
ncbi:MAG: hypothetical protein NWQ37_10575, partial [Marivita lacus]|nr:hypothetical protein [Marivita lacus]